MHWVVDCSFASALFLPDEHSPVVKEFFSDISESKQLLVPLLWWYEISNVLIVSVRRGRLENTSISHIISLFEDLNLETDGNLGAIYAKDICKIAQQYNLSANDSAYLELALRSNASIASLDKQLIRVAKDIGIEACSTS